MRDSNMQINTNKEMQRKRMMSYFIDATDELIGEVGISGITLRKVADNAGYNSATIYNYFENLDHLIFYAAMRNIKDYAQALNTYLLDARNSMDKFLKVWECFCDYAFDNPEIYNAIFFPNLEKHTEYYLTEYYDFYPADLVSMDENISAMLLKRDIRKRGEVNVLECVKEGYIRPEDGEKLNDMSLLIFQGILIRSLNNMITYEDARNTTMDYIKSIVKPLLIKDYIFYY